MFSLFTSFKRKFAHFRINYYCGRQTKKKKQKPRKPKNWYCTNAFNGSHKSTWIFVLVFVFVLLVSWMRIRSTCVVKHKELTWLKKLHLLTGPNKSTNSTEISLLVFSQFSVLIPYFASSETKCYRFLLSAVFFVFFFFLICYSVLFHFGSDSLYVFNSLNIKLQIYSSSAAGTNWS